MKNQQRGCSWFWSNLSGTRLQLGWCWISTGWGWYEKERQRWLSCIGLALDTGRVITTTGRNIILCYLDNTTYFYIKSYHKDFISEHCLNTPMFFLSKFETLVKILCTRNIPRKLREKLSVSSDFHQSLIVPILQPPMTTILESCDHKWPSNTIVPTSSWAQTCKMSQIWQIYLCKNIGRLG